MQCILNSPQCTTLKGILRHPLFSLQNVVVSCHILSTSAPNYEARSNCGCGKMANYAFPFKWEVEETAAASGENYIFPVSGSTMVDSTRCEVPRAWLIFHSTKPSSELLAWYSNWYKYMVVTFSLWTKYLVKNYTVEFTQIFISRFILWIRNCQWRALVSFTHAYNLNKRGSTHMTVCI